MARIRDILVFFFIVGIISSCLNRQFVEGKAEIVSITDTFLHDSSLVIGHIYHMDWSEEENYLENEFEVWIENSYLNTTNDSIGHYSIKTLPGTYTIKCQRTQNVWEKLIEEVESIELSKNKKAEINFHIGYTIE